MPSVYICAYVCVNIQMKRKELTRRDYEDGDSMLSSTLSDGGSTKRKRYIYSISETTGLELIIVLNIHAMQGWQLIVSLTYYLRQP